MRTILIVEDELALADVLQEILIELGYAAAVVTNGQLALAYLTQHRPTAILSDIMMPVMDGVALTRTLRTSPTYHTLPIILMSAIEHPPAVQHDLATAFIQKPFALATLAELLEAIVGTDGA